MPTELRKEIYEYILGKRVALTHLIAITSTCRQLRAEFMPFYLTRTSISISIHRAESFFRTFFSKQVVTDKTAAVCSMRLRIAAVELWSRLDDYPTMEMKWLLTFLVDHPNIKVNFEGEGICDSEARDLDMLLLLARTKPTFRKVLKALHCIEVVTSFWPLDDRQSESHALWALNIYYSTWRSYTVQERDKRMFGMMEAMGLQPETSLTFEPEQYPRLRESKLFARMKLFWTMT